MASTAEIHSLLKSQTRDLSRYTDPMLISILREHHASELDAAHQRWQDINALSGKIDQPHGWYLLKEAIGSIGMEPMKTAVRTWFTKKMVSIPNTSDGNSPNSPKFVGTKTTMEFKPADGCKAVVGMTRYNLLTTREDGDGLDLDDELSLCHVYPLEGKGKGNRNRNGKRSRAPDHCNDVVLPPLDELDQEISKVDVTKYCPVGVDDYSVDVPDLPSTDSSKRPRPESKHWHNFTKIHTKNPEVIYAACNHCDTMLKLTGGTKCGTGSLRHHSDSCRCKPKQEQLPGNSSSIFLAQQKYIT